MDNSRTPRTTPMYGGLMNGGQQRCSVRDEELAHLEAEIKKAYVLKSLEAQLAEQEADRMAAAAQNKLEEAMALTRFEADRVKEEKIKADLGKRTEKLRESLNRQIEEKREEKSNREQEDRQERRILTELDQLREMFERDEKQKNKEDVAQRMNRQKFVQQEIHKIERSKQQQLEAKEELLNEDYARELGQRSEQLKRLRDEERTRRQAAIEKVAKMLLEQQAHRDERHRLLSELLTSEAKVDVELEAREAELRRRQIAKDLAEDLEEQMRFEEECRRRFLEREREFAEAVMAKVMASEEMERLTAESRRRRRIEYREELERLMMERERVRAEELVKIRTALEVERLIEETEMEEAKKERLALLEQHIDNVAGYLDVKSLNQVERGVVETARK